MSKPKTTIDTDKQGATTKELADKLKDLHPVPQKILPATERKERAKRRPRRGNAK